MRRVTAARPAWWKITAVALGAGLLTAACSSSSTTTPPPSSPPATSAAASPAATANAALCADADALRTSLRNLTHISVGKDSADQIKSGIANVKKTLTGFTTQAKGEYQAQTGALKSALDKLQTAASSLKSNPGVSTVADTVSALTGVATAAGSLLTAVGAKCPSASPST
jgi:hypothetical protein